jgi:hypothetical protein
MVAPSAGQPTDIRFVFFWIRHCEFLIVDFTKDNSGSNEKNSASCYEILNSGGQEGTAPQPHQPG